MSAKANQQQGDGLSETTAQEGADAASVRQRWAMLTVREREVAGLMASGLSRRQIAIELRLSMLTTVAYEARVVGKMQAHTRMELQQMLQQALNHTPDSQRETDAR